MEIKPTPLLLIKPTFTTARPLCGPLDFLTLPELGRLFHLGASREGDGHIPQSSSVFTHQTSAQV